VSIKSS